MTSSLILREVWQGLTTEYGRAFHLTGSLWFQWLVYPPLDKWIWEGTPATLNIWLKNEKYLRKGCASYWKFSSRKNMKEEFNLHQKHYNSVWGLSELTVGVLSSVCLSAALPGPGAPSDIAGRDGERKTSLLHPVTSYSAVHQGWCGTRFLIQQTCWKNEGWGGWREEGMVLFCMMR